MELKGKHAFVTGAGLRVGRAIAEALLERGVKVSAHYRHSEKAVQELKLWASQRGAEVFPVAADLTDLPSLTRALETSEKFAGAPQILINSASDFTRTPSLDCTEKQWDALFDVNLKGQFFLTQAYAKHLGTGAGAIVNICDVYAVRPLRNFSPYAASKAGLSMLTRNLALEWSPRIRVNSVSPGAVLPPENYTEEQKKKAAERSLFQRWGEPKDIAQAVIFLLENDYITGFDLKVDGGKSLA